MGNAVGTLTWASRDEAFYTPPHPQRYYDEHAEACRILMPRFDRLLNKFCGFTAGCNGDSESDRSESTKGHVVCLVVLL